MRPDQGRMASPRELYPLVLSSGHAGRRSWGVPRASFIVRRCTTHIGPGAVAGGSFIPLSDTPFQRRVPSAVDKTKRWQPKALSYRALHATSMWQ